MIQDRSFPQFADFADFADFPQFVKFLKAQLARPLPGQVAQFQMAPLSRRQPEMASISANTPGNGRTGAFLPMLERATQALTD